MPFEHLLSLFADQIQLDIPLNGPPLVFRADPIQRTPLLTRVRVVPDNLSTLVLQVLETVHHLSIHIPRLGNVNVIQGVGRDNGEFLGGGPTPVVDGIGELHTLDLLFLGHVEDLHDTALVALVFSL